VARNEAKTLLGVLGLCGRSKLDKLFLTAGTPLGGGFDLLMPTMFCSHVAVTLQSRCLDYRRDR